MRTRVLVLAPLMVFTAVVVACGSADRRNGFSDSVDSGGGSSGKTGFTDPDSGGGCAGLACKVATDCNGSPTTLRGKVYDPAGANPLYNVQVYIPSGQDPGTLPPMKDSTQDGITCETCASTVLSPLVATLT